MKVHVVGNGGREHALRTVLGRTAEVIDSEDDADFVVIGPETPLVAGKADELRAKGKLVYGPGADGARLEGSKAFMKDFVARAGVPTARYGTFSEIGDAEQFLRTLAPPYVVKTDGLAGGKGVFISDSLDDAYEDVRDKLSGSSFGDAGKHVVIEEGLTGPELSLLYVFDGKDGVALPFAQDYKRYGDGNTGPNTGGIGAYSPVPVADDGVAKDVLTNIIEPTCAQLIKEGIDYRGTLYAGIMLTQDGPKLLEYNVRFGDPETQVVLPRFGGDLTATLASAAAGKLEVSGPVATEDACVTVVLTAPGYPTAPESGALITGVRDAEAMPGITVFRAGVSETPEGELHTRGGRVLNVTAKAPTIAEARDRAYQAARIIVFDRMHYRTDVALGVDA